MRTAEVRISDGAVQDLASAAPWTIAATSVGTQSLTNTDATLRAAAAAAGLVFVSPITGSVYSSAGTLVATHGPWITGTGRVGATTGTGNADTCIGTDATHPTDAGHTYLASRVVAAIQELTA
ncbi:hypothetical protein ACIQZO_05245 [Streptomyces sp. NPDC097617]|uniref:hypothetical protein n=1 Tax=Streptomyces sp. NPDC097617 TaxID=3366091 RepID=UPI00381F5315